MDAARPVPSPMSRQHPEPHPFAPFMMPPPPFPSDPISPIPSAPLMNLDEESNNDLVVIKGGESCWCSWSQNSNRGPRSSGRWDLKDPCKLRTSFFCKLKLKGTVKAKVNAEDNFAKWGAESLVGFRKCKSMKGCKLRKRHMDNHHCLDLFGLVKQVK